MPKLHVPDPDWIHGDDIAYDNVEWDPEDYDPGPGCEPEADQDEIDEALDRYERNLGDKG